MPLAPQRVPFTYRRPKTTPRKGRKATPGSELPTYSLMYTTRSFAQDAYRLRISSLLHINANGFTEIKLSSTYVQPQEALAHYQYDAVANTSPSLDIACDVASPQKAPSNPTALNTNSVAACRAYITFRFSSLARTTITERPTMDWADVVTSAGAYFALIQFICWVVSGIAWTGPDSHTSEPRVWRRECNGFHHGP